MKKNNKSITWKILIAILLISVFILIITLYSSSNQKIGYVGKYAITKEELEFYKNEEKSNVQNYFTKTYNISLSDADWNKALNGEVPNDKLLEYALENCIDTKVLFALAYELGLSEYVDYDDFQTALSAENASREEAVAAGEIVYGVINFSAREYLGHLRTKLENEIKTALSSEKEDALYISEDEIKQYFEENQEEWLFNGTTLYVTELQIPKDDESAKELAVFLKKQLELGTGIDGLSDIEKESIVEIEREFTASSYSQDMSACYEVRSAADEMAVNEIRILKIDSTYSVICLKEKVVDIQKAYQEYSIRIKEVLLSEKYEQFFNEYKGKLGYREK